MADVSCGIYGIPIQFGEREGSGKITFAKGSIKGTRIFQMPWDNYISYINTLLGSQVGTPAGAVTLSYPDAFSTDYPFLYCQEVDVDGESISGLSGGRISYRVARVTATYSPLDNEESIHLGGQMLTLPRERYGWIGQRANNPAQGNGYRISVPRAASSGSWQTDGVTVPAGATAVQIEKLFEARYGFGNVYAYTYDKDVINNTADFFNFRLIIRNAKPDLGAQLKSTLSEFPLSFKTDTVGIVFNGDPGGVTWVWKITDVNQGKTGTTPVFSTTADANGLLQDIRETIADGVNQTLQGMESNFTSVSVDLVPPGNRGYKVFINDQTGNPAVGFVLTAQNVALQPKALNVDIFTDQDPLIQQLDEPIGKFMPTGEYSLDRHKVQTTSLNTLLFLMGTVNSSSFLGFPSLTLLFTGVDAKRTYTATGQSCWDISFKFQYNPYTWEALYRPDRNRWEYVKATSFTAADPLAGVLLDISGQPTGLVSGGLATDYGLIYPVGEFAALMMLF